GGFLAALLQHVVADGLAVLQAGEARALDRADMDEDVLAAVIRLDKAETLLRVEPLHFSGRHGEPLFIKQTVAIMRFHAGGRAGSEETGSSSFGECAAAGPDPGAGGREHGRNRAGWQYECWGRCRSAPVRA